jgi:DNA-binding NtrC family response regulator
MSNPILLCAPPCVRAADVVRALARDLELVPLPDVESVAAACGEQAPVAVVLPLAEPPLSGPGDGVLGFLRACPGDTAVFLYGSRLPADVRREALAAGARWVLDAEAPSFREDLRRLLADVVHDSRLKLEEERARSLLFAEHGLLGESAAMREVFRRAILASQFSNLAILIAGPRGAPRHRLAAAIRHFDPVRGTRPFIALGCGCLADGGTSRQPWESLFRAAAGGTLFLDHIGELAEPDQDALLAVSGAIGGGGGRPTDVRVIAGTEGTLEEAVARGAFRPELYTWLSLFPIDLPPLCGRPQDIAAQARHALRAAQAGRERATVDFDREALAALERLPWMGNTQELEQVVWETLARMGRGPLVRIEDLPEEVREAARERPSPGGEPGSPAGRVGDRSLERALENYERRLLRAILRRARLSTGRRGRS